MLLHSQTAVTNGKANRKEKPQQSDKPSEAKLTIPQPHQRWRSQSSEATANCPKTPPKKATPRDGDGEAESNPKAERPAGPASFFLREEIGRIVALRRGCCLSEASFSTFRYKPPDFSKKNAALIFCFFWVKPKEKAFSSKQKEQNNSKQYHLLKTNKLHSK